MIPVHVSIAGFFRVFPIAVFTMLTIRWLEQRCTGLSPTICSFVSFSRRSFLVAMYGYVPIQFLAHFYGIPGALGNAVPEGDTVVTILDDEPVSYNPRPATIFRPVRFIDHGFNIILLRPLFCQGISPGSSAGYDYFDSCDFIKGFPEQVIIREAPRTNHSNFHNQVLRMICTCPFRGKGVETHYNLFDKYINSVRYS